MPGEGNPVDPGGPDDDPPASDPAPDSEQPVAAPSPRQQLGPGRKLIEPPGYELVSFLVTLGIVIGVGLAWDGLWLAAAAVVLSVIESREMIRLNPWIVSKDGRPSPLTAKPVVRLMRVSFMSTVLGAAVAYYTVDMSGNWLAAVPPAILAGIINLALNYQLKVLLSKQ